MDGRICESGEQSLNFNDKELHRPQGATRTRSYPTNLLLLIPCNAHNQLGTTMDMGLWTPCNRPQKKRYGTMNRLLTTAAANQALLVDIPTSSVVQDFCLLTNAVSNKSTARMYSIEFKPLVFIPQLYLPLAPPMA